MTPTLTLARHVIELLSPHGHLVEVGGKLPDINFVVRSTTATTPFERRTVEGWIDPMSATRPHRDDTRVKVLVDKDKRKWWLAREKAGGTVFVLLRLRPATSGAQLVLLLRGGTAAEALDHDNVDELISKSVARFSILSGLAAGSELARWLVS